MINYLYYVYITNYDRFIQGTSKNDVVGVKLDVLRGLPDRGQA